MSYLKKFCIKSTQIVSNEKQERILQGKMTCNENNLNALIKRIELLELENDKLRKENEMLKKKSRPSINAIENKSQVTSSKPLSKILPLFNNKAKGCTCKGNCSSKICGCTKKNLHCNDTCKCNSSTCRNKEKDKENRPKIVKERAKSLSNQSNHQNGNISETINHPALKEKNPQQPEPNNVIDDVFYDAIDPNAENVNINAAKKLTFFSDDDTLDDRAIELSAIEEMEEESSINTARKNSASDKKKIANEYKQSSSNKTENPNVNGSKLTNAKKPSDPNKNDHNAKTLNKERKSKQTSSVQKKSINENKEETRPDVANINLRSRQKKTTSDEETANKSKKPAEHLNLDFIKSTGVTSCIKSISNLKQPKNWNQAGSSHSNDDNNYSPKITRSRRNYENSVETIVAKNSKTSSRISGLRRSFSCETISVEQDDAQRKFTKSRSTSRESLTKIEDKPRARSLNHSRSNENLSRRLTYKVSHSFRRSKSSDNVGHRQKCTLTPVTESPQVAAAENNSNSQIDKSLKFDPMQPTYQLSRSPIPPVSISNETPDTSTTNSPPIFSRFLSSKDLQIFSPPPEILQDLNEEEVDPEKFQSKLIKCRKCKRSFFPHRIHLHEAVCLKK